MVRVFFTIITLFWACVCTQAQNNLYPEDIRIRSYSDSKLWGSYTKLVYEQYQLSLFKEQLTNQDSIDFRFWYAETSEGHCHNYLYQHAQLKFKPDNQYQLQIALHPHEQIFAYQEGNYSSTNHQFSFSPLKNTPKEAWAKLQLLESADLTQLILPLELDSLIFSYRDGKKERAKTKEKISWERSFYLNADDTSQSVYVDAGNAVIAQEDRLKSCNRPEDLPFRKNGVLVSSWTFKIPANVVTATAYSSIGEISFQVPKTKGKYLVYLYHPLTTSAWQADLCFDEEIRISQALRTVRSYGLELKSFAPFKKWEKTYLIKDYPRTRFRPK